MKILLPTVADNNYQGHKIAKWLLMIYVFKSFFAGCVHMFAPDGGAQSIGSVTLDQFTLNGADSVITMFGLWGMEQFIIGLIGFIIIRRYQSLIPLMCSVYVLEYIMRGISDFYTPGLSTAHNPPGAVADYILIPLAIIMFLLSLKNKLK